MNLISYVLESRCPHRAKITVEAGLASSRYSRIVALNLCIMTPTGGHFSDFYIIIHNSSKLQLINDSRNEIILGFGGQYNMRNGIKGLQHWEG